MKNLTWQNPEQLFVAQVLINKVKSKCCGIKDKINKIYFQNFESSLEFTLSTTKINNNLKISQKFSRKKSHNSFPYKLIIIKLSVNTTQKRITLVGGVILYDCDII